MKHEPFLLKLGGKPDEREPGKDSVITSEDPLPAIAEVRGGGFPLNNGTRVTEVKHETTDDN